MQADRVADAVVQQRADADGALDAAILSIARPGDSEMDRDNSSPALPRRGAPRAGGRPRSSPFAASLDFIENTKSWKSEVTRDPRKLQRALHHAERRVAVAVHDAVAQAPVVRPDADRHAEACIPAPAA